MQSMIDATTASRVNSYLEQYKSLITSRDNAQSKIDEINAKYGSATPVQVIDQQAYGVMDGEKVLKSAIRLIKQNKK